MERRHAAPLINPTWEEMTAREPLLVFSFYLSGRVNVLLSIADEVVVHLDAGFAGGIVYGAEVGRASDLMWLWSLAAYEVVRTICAVPECFSQSAQDRFKVLKGHLAEIRMPSAKMEQRGKKIPVTSNRSPDGWDLQNKDLLIGDPNATQTTSARALLREFEDAFASISVGDVLKPHQSAYGAPIG